MDEMTPEEQAERIRRLQARRGTAADAPGARRRRRRRHGMKTRLAFTALSVASFGSLVGAMLPFLLRRLGFDPATASAPFVATLVDVTGLVIYFTAAMIILRGTLL